MSTKMLVDGNFMNEDEWRGHDVAASQRVRGFVVGSHLFSSLVEMKLALSREEESQ
jgi:hypothetical protein